jgi:hypothetical protein
MIGMIESSIYELIQKLKTQGDITIEEADWIYSLFSRDAMYTTLYPSSPKFNSELSQALQEWYEVVAEKIKADERGNFVFTVFFSENTHFNKLLSPAHEAIEKHGTFEDLCNVIMIDEKTYSTLPFKHLFSEVKENLKNFYKLKTPRVGMLNYPIYIENKAYTVGELMKRFYPIGTSVSFEDVNHALSEEAYKVAVGAREVVQKLFVFGRYVRLITLAAFMRYKDFSCVAALDAYNSAFVTFTEKDKAPIIKDVLEIPFEELVQNAVRERVIDKKTAKTLLDNYPITNFPLKDFTETSVRFLDDVVRRKMEWKVTRNAIEYETEWMEEIR